LAILYEEQKKDYPRAIVHFKSYLESVDGRNEDVQRMLDRVERLYLEVLTQKHLNGPMPATNDRQPTTTDPTPTTPRVTVVPPIDGSTATTRQRTYVVREGDNLSGISIKVYGTAKHVDRIFKANARTLKSPEKIKVGQTLIIPDVSE
jgi:nucleoid-associated protein YgaU